VHRQLNLAEPARSSFADSEPVSCVAAVGSPAEGEYLTGLDGKHDDWREFRVLGVVEVPVAGHELKCPVPPGRPDFG